MKYVRSFFSFRNSNHSFVTTDPLVTLVIVRPGMRSVFGWSSVVAVILIKTSRKPK